MSNPFDFRYNQYRQQFAPLPVDDIIQVGEAWNQQYMQGVQQSDMLKDQILNIKVTDADTVEKDRLTQGALASIEDFSKNGNFEDAPIAAMQIARGLKDNAWLNNAMQRYAGIQADMEKLREYDASDAQMYGFQQHLKKYGATPTQRNKFGEYDRYSGFDAFKEPDVRKMVNEEMDAIKSTKVSDIRYDDERGTMYIINGEEVSEDRLYQMAVSTVMNDPKASKLLDWEVEMNFESMTPEQRAAIAQGTVNQRQAQIEARRKTLQSLTGPASMTMPADTAARREEVLPIIQEASKTAGVDPNLIDFIAYQESRYRPHVVSKAKAKGMMQFMDGTAADYDVNPFDPESSIKGAARYMNDLIARYGGDTEKALAAYNYGMGNVDKKVREAGKMGKDWRDLLPKETKDYLQSWNAWTGPSPENKQLYELGDRMLTEEANELEKYRQLAESPEGIDLMSKSILRNQILERKYRPMAQARAYDNRTISNLRGGNQTRVDSDRTGILGDDAYFGYGQAGPNELSALSSSDIYKDKPSFWNSLNKAADVWNEIPKGYPTVAGIDPLKYFPVFKIASAFHKQEKDKSEKEKQLTQNYEERLKTWLTSDTANMLQEIVGQYGMQVVDLKETSPKKVIQEGIKNNQNRPVPFVNLGEKGSKLLGVQEDDKGTPLQDNTYFYVLGDKTDGGGSMANTRGVTDTEAAIYKRLGKNSDDHVIEWSRRGISAANAQGIPGAIYYVATVKDKKTGQTVGQTGVLRSNASKTVESRFSGLLQGMASFAYSGIPGVQKFGEDGVAGAIINVPAKTSNGIQIVPFYMDPKGEFVPFDQYIETATREAFRTNKEQP